jgi:hypothetical protein
VRFCSICPPQCAALRMAELYTGQAVGTNYLTSRTDADAAALEAVFAGVIHPDPACLM